MKTTTCARCWKVIKKFGSRKYCIPCRKEVDREQSLLTRVKNNKTWKFKNMEWVEKAKELLAKMNK